MGHEQEQHIDNKITYYQERSYCHREDCLVCNINEGHGPYWYASMEINDRVLRIYLGDKFVPVSEENFLQSKVFQNPFEPSKDSENIFSDEAEANKNSKPDYFTDRIDTSKIPKKDDKTVAKKRVPTQQEFEKDLRSFGQERTKKKLRLAYRQLIKKYHPDQFENKSKTTYWMAEINNTYQTQLKEAN